MKLPSLACPWCGHPPYVDVETAKIMGKRSGHTFAIACRHCEACAPAAPTFEAAVTLWETRNSKEPKT